MAKLSGITTISEKQLSALNTTLLAELAAISKLKVSDEEKARLQQEAWGRYNDAIKYAGGLAALSTYSQRLQDQELLIQRLASIAEISAAQTAADNIKQAALEKYLATLGKPLPVSKAPPAVIVVPPRVITPDTPRPGYPEDLPNKGGLPGLGGGGMAVIADIITNNGNGIPIDIPGSDFPNKRGLDLGGGGTVLNFNAPITTTSTDEFARLVQKAIQNEKRFGNNLDYAGAI